MNYRQLTSEERYMLAALRRQGFNQAQIARSLGRHRSTVCREVGRNCTRADGRNPRLHRSGAHQRAALPLAPQPALHAPRLDAR